MRIMETKVFNYSELTPRAQEAARDWYRQAGSGDLFWSEYPTDDFKEILTAAGFELSNRHGDDVLYWSGFSSQGDGAAFGATWRAKDVNVAPAIEDRPVRYTDSNGAIQICPSNARLIPILERIAALAVKYPDAVAEIACADRSKWTRCERACASVDDEENDGGDDEALRVKLESIAQDLAAYFYRSLEEAYDYENSDENVAETIDANDYEFTEEGRIV